MRLRYFGNAGWWALPQSDAATGWRSDIIAAVHEAGDVDATS